MLKLGPSQDAARALTGGEPTGGEKPCWVTLHFALDAAPPLDALRAMVDESFRLQAPKKRVALLDSRPIAP